MRTDNNASPPANTSSNFSNLTGSTATPIPTRFPAAQ